MEQLISYDFFSDIRGDIPNDAFQMQRLWSRRGNHSRNQLKKETLGSTDLGATIFIAKDTFKVRNWCWDNTSHRPELWLLSICAPQQPTRSDIFTQEMQFPRCLKLKRENINYNKKMMLWGWTKNNRRQMSESTVFFSQRAPWTHSVLRYMKDFSEVRVH